MTTLEQAFDDTKKAADSTLKSANDMVKLAKQLQKSAQEGNIGAMKKATSGLEAALGALRQDVANAGEVWPFKDEAEERYLAEHYPDELRYAALAKGLDIYHRDGRLISYPSIVQILPEHRKIIIDKKPVETIRPSFLTEILVKNQKKMPKYTSAAFLEALYKVYEPLAELERNKRLIKDPVIPLSKIYELFTVRPGTKPEYDKTEFARNLYFLQADGTLRTRKGLLASISNSTGAKKVGGTFQFVGPDGNVQTFFGIRFSMED